MDGTAGSFPSAQQRVHAGGDSGPRLPQQAFSFQEGFKAGREGQGIAIIEMSHVSDAQNLAFQFSDTSGDAQAKAFLKAVLDFGRCQTLKGGERRQRIGTRLMARTARATRA